MPWLRVFESHLKLLGNKETTIETTLKGIRVVVYQAIRYGVLEQKENLFFNCSIKTAKSYKARLTHGEIKK